VIRVNGRDEVFYGETVGELLVRLEIETRGIAVAVNGEIVRRSEWSTSPVPDGGHVEVVTAVAGG